MQNPGQCWKENSLDLNAKLWVLWNKWAQLIGRSRGCRRHAPPQQDPILSFSHPFSRKSARVGGRRPPMRNSGSTTATEHRLGTMRSKCISCTKTRTRSQFIILSSLLSCNITEFAIFFTVELFPIAITYLNLIGKWAVESKAILAGVMARVVL